MRREVMMFVLSAVATALTFGEATSLATNPSTYRTFHPIDCLIYANSGNIVYDNGGPVQNSSTTVTAELWCQAPHDSYLPLNANGTGTNLHLEVTGWDTAISAGAQCSGGGGGNKDCALVTNGTSNLCARACRTFYGGSGGSCGNWKGNSPGSGSVQHVQPELSCWVTSTGGACASGGAYNDTYFVDVFMCYGSGSNLVAVWGMDVYLQ